MLVLHAAGVAVAAVAATLSVSSARNMWQTFQVASSSSSAAASSSSSSSAPTTFSDFTPGLSAAETVQLLQSCNRRELLQVYLYNTVDMKTFSLMGPPHNKTIDGDWDGILLDNNGFLMTRVSQFLTHSLFGRGRRWNGKAFLADKPTTSSNMDGSIGKNRFISSSAKGSKATIEASNIIRYDHSFDFGFETSRISPNLESLVLRYNQHQKFRTSGWTSLLWKSMVDEIRMVECKDGDCVLLGLGCMAWSGGMLNGSPFCLFRPVEEEGNWRIYSYRLSEETRGETRRPSCEYNCFNMLETLYLLKQINENGKMKSSSVW